MERAIPILPADSIAVARDFYGTKLGFNVLFEASEDGVTGLIGLRRRLRPARAASPSPKTSAESA